ncbi:hypothetical protein DFH28DRAFT_884161 [Melampsora americana]|nr:hypothetical protein DFH28DRAFT_884161 [Melampsora americana]
MLVSIRWILIISSRAWRNRTWALWPERIDWTEQIVLITGGADGLGRVIAETLAMKHITVVVLDVKPFVNSGEELEYDIHHFVCDVSNPKSVEEVTNRIKKEIGDPTIVINNAGTVNGRLIIDLQPDELQRSFGVNVMSHFLLLKAFLPQMIKNGTGHIVTIASVLGTMGISQASDYCASKAASISLHESLRLELDSRYHCPRVRTTLVCPGRLETKMFEKLRPQNKFFLPQVAPHDLAKLIIQSLDSHLSSDIYVPVYTGWMWIIRGLPSWAKDFAHWIVGSNEAMMNFQPVSKQEDCVKG